MSLVPSARIQVFKEVSNEQFYDVLREIKETKGVSSVRFNEAARRVAVNYKGASTLDKVKKIKGVETVRKYTGH